MFSWEEMKETLESEISPNKSLFAPFIQSEQFKDEPWIVLMQYTGLKDKNGKEIYEGDIVTCNGGYETIEGSSGECEHPRLVEHSKEGTLQIVASCKHCLSDTPLYEFDLNEVIGNIYENSELLK